MRPKDTETARSLDQQLSSFEAAVCPLPGIAGPSQREALIEQILESIRRVRFVSVVSSRPVSHLCTNPSNESFDPLKAAIQFRRQELIDESFWMVFLFVYFGKHRRTGWRLARDVYGCLGNGQKWDWERISNNPADFREWLAANISILEGGDGVPRRFGNHRKYETLKLTTNRGTANAFASYVAWVNPPRTHQEIVDEALNQANSNSRWAFDILYQSMQEVISFGRTAIFDYLTMIGKLGLTPIEPGSTYMRGATGPVNGARLLFGGQKSSSITLPDLEKHLVDLEAHLGIGNFGMQVLEDALCNWQKSPDKFAPFRG